MCGFSAIITLRPSAHSDGALGSTISANSNTNGYTNGSSLNHGLNGSHLNGHSDSNEAQGKSNIAAQLQAAVDAINHRGPDESNVWVNEDGTVGLGHCRLSIVDLSPSGSQPLHSDDGLIHAVVNGEIYDHDRIRDFCISEHGYQFVGHSDSELVLALYKICGAPAMFEHLRGEFSFVLYDSHLERIIACRDRYGIKPIVWTVVGQKLLIASETKAFMSMGWQAEWDVKAIVDAGWMTDDRTLFKGVRKILPGYWMEVTGGEIQHHKYWDAEYKDKVCLINGLPIKSAQY
jgi:asparagine synthase (glutamine-hydrolysing)